MRGKVEPFILQTMVRVVPMIVQEVKQTIKIPQMTSLHERQLREQQEEIKEEHDTRVPGGEKHMHFDANVYENWMESIVSPQHL